MWGPKAVLTYLQKSFMPTGGGAAVILNFKDGRSPALQDKGKAKSVFIKVSESTSNVTINLWFSSCSIHPTGCDDSQNCWSGGRTRH